MWKCDFNKVALQKKISTKQQYIKQKMEIMLNNKRHNNTKSTKTLNEKLTQH